MSIASLKPAVNVLMNPETLKTLAHKHLMNTFPMLEDRVIDALVAHETIHTPDKVETAVLKMVKKILPDYDETSQKGLLKNRKIILDKHLSYPTDVNINIDDYLIKLSIKQQPKVVVSKLKCEVVQILTGTHWTNIDPYSDIDEITDTDSEEPIVVNTSVQIDSPYSESDGLYFQMAGGHCLRKRKKNIFL